MLFSTRKTALAALALVLVGVSSLWADQAPLAIENDRFLFTDAAKLSYDKSELVALDRRLAGHEVEILHWAAYATIDPRLLALLVLEAQVDLGDTVTARDAIAAIARRVSDEFYRHYDDPARRQDAASQALTRFFGDDRRQAADLLERYARLVPEKAAPQAATAPATAVPADDYLLLPFGIGSAWFFGGTHTYTGTDPGPRSSLDFYDGQDWGQNTTGSPVTAAHGGRFVIYSPCSVGIIGDDGWSTSYYHLGILYIADGAQVDAGTVIATYADNLPQALCGGGHSSLPHVHLSLLRNGAYVSLDGVSLSRWVVHDGRYSYDRECEFSYMERAGERYCPGARLPNDGLGQPSVTVGISVLDGVAGEPANAGRFRVFRSGGGTSAPLSVNLGFEGSSQSGVDYAPLGPAIELPAGAAELEVELQVLDDAVPEPLETAILTLQPGAGYQIGNLGRAGLTIADDDQPAAPTDLVATGHGGAEVALAWVDHADNETGFRVERRLLPAGAFALLATAGANTSSFTDAAVDTGLSYGYRVRAENVAGGSAYSNEATVTTSGELAPTGLVATALAGEQVALSWVDRSAGRASFEIEGRFAALDQPFEKLGIAPAGATTLTLSGLVPDVDYLFRVRSRGGLGDSGASAKASTRTFPAAPGVCQENASTTCLLGERFAVSLRWRDFLNARGAGKVVPAGAADSGLFYFFTPDNWELLVKVLDGCALNGRQWVFAAATTNVEYTLIVTDRQTGHTALYGNPLGQVAPAITDTDAFEGCGTATATALRAAPSPVSLALAPAATSTCAAGAEAMCLAGQRFQVDIAWRDFAGTQGTGQVVPFGTDNSGLFTFFSPDNWEILVKVLDGCALNNHFWVFAAGTTTVEYTLSVRDTAHPELPAQTYRNPLGTAALPVTDTAAFTCQ